jgi:hypothetical protein
VRLAALLLAAAGCSLPVSGQDPWTDTPANVPDAAPAVQAAPRSFPSADSGPDAPAPLLRAPAQPSTPEAGADVPAPPPDASPVILDAGIPVAVEGSCAPSGQGCPGGDYCVQRITPVSGPSTGTYRLRTLSCEPAVEVLDGAAVPNACGVSCVGDPLRDCCVL